MIHASVWEQYLIDSLPELNRAPGLTSRELMDLKAAVVKVVKRIDNKQLFANDVGPGFIGDVLHNNYLLKAAISRVLSKFHGVQIEGDNFDVKIHQTGEEQYEATMNLNNKLSLDAQEIHNAIRSGIMSIGSVVQRIGEMKAYTALSGFAEEELPLFRTKLRALADRAGSNAQEAQFDRIVALGGLPSVASGQHVDINKVLEIRNEPEAVEFRAWRANAPNVSDSEVKQRVAGFRAKLGNAVQGNTGKIVRFVVGNVLGVLNAGLGIAISAIDQFLLEKFLHKSQVAALVHKLYPSVFRQE